MTNEDDMERYALWAPPVAKEPRFYGGCGAVTGPGHWSEYGDLQYDQRHPVQVFARPQSA
jgi:hypothetical protein